MRGDLVETELLVIVRTDPFRAVDGAFLKRRIDVAAGNLLWYRAHLLEHAAGEATDAEFETLEVVNAGDLLAEPAAHLASGVAREQRHDVYFL